MGPCTGGHRGVDSVGLSPGCPRYRLRGLPGLPGGGASPRRRWQSGLQPVMVTGGSRSGARAPARTPPLPGGG